MCWVMPPLSVVDDVRLADPVQERRLAVVDVAEDRDDRRPGDEVFGGRVVGPERLEHVVLGGPLVDDLELDAELQGEHLRRLVVEVGVDADELAHVGHQPLDQVVGADADRLGEAADVDRRLDLGVALAGRGERRAVAPLLAPPAAGAVPLGLLVLVQQGGGGDGRGDPALGGALGRAWRGGRRGRRGCRAGPRPCSCAPPPPRSSAAAGAAGGGRGAGGRAARSAGAGRAAGAAGQAAAGAAGRAAAAGEAGPGAGPARRGRAGRRGAVACRRAGPAASSPAVLRACTASRAAGS